MSNSGIKNKQIDSRKKHKPKKQQDLPKTSQFRVNWNAEYLLSLNLSIYLNLLLPFSMKYMPEHPVYPYYLAQFAYFCCALSSLTPLS